jgi:predicted HicB family RNase H-like nuclease
MIEYKGYIGHFSFDEEKKMFFGKVANCHDFITFQGKSVSELKQSFRDSVEEYIAWCKRYRKEKTNPPEQKNEKESK